MIDKKSIYRKAARLLLAAFLCFFAKPAVADNVVVGNTDGRTVTYEQIGKTDTAGVAMFFPSSTMRAYKGCKITQLDLQLYDVTTTDALQIFISRSLSGPHDYSETLTANQTNMSITLNTPYEITGDTLYIGYTIEGARYLCYTNRITTGQEWIWKKSEGWTRYEKSFSANLTATIEGKNLPADVNLSYAYMPEFSLTASSVPFSAQMINLGAQTVSNLTVTYYVDGQSYSQETVSIPSTQSRKSCSFSLSEFQMAAEGDHQVSFAITAVNGKDDGIPSNNSSRTTRMLFRNEFVGAPVVLEVFSTERCTQCPSAHQIIDRLVDGANDVIEIGHHAGFYTDSLTVSTSTEYEWFYNPSNVSAPAIMVNRGYMVDNLPGIYDDESPIVSVGESTLSTLLTQNRLNPAYYDVDIEKTFDADTRQLSLQVSASELLSWPTPDSLRLFVMLTEDSIYTTSQRGASSGYYHRHSLREMLTPTWGTPLSSIGGDGVATFSFTIPEEWQPSMMNAIAFVGNYNSNDRTDCRIVGAAKVEVDENRASAIPSIAADATNSGLQVTDIQGRTVLKTNNISAIKQLPRGLYIIKSGKRVSKISL